MHKTMRVAAVLAALTMMSVPAFAQGGPPGGFGGFGGGQFGRGGGGGELSVVQVPLETLSTALKLTPEQSDKIKAMQDKLAAQRTAMRPQGGFGGGNGGGFDREAMQQMMEEMRAKQEQLRNQETKDSKAIEAMLTADQAAALKATLPGWKVVRQMGVDLKYADSLKLTAEQIAVLEKAFKERAAQMQGGGRRGGGNKAR